MKRFAISCVIYIVCFLLLAGICSALISVLPAFLLGVLLVFVPSVLAFGLGWWCHK